jgi:hypothetical protein
MSSLPSKPLLQPQSLVDLFIPFTWLAMQDFGDELADARLMQLLPVQVLGVVDSQFSTNPQVVGALGGMGAVTTGLMATTTLKLAVGFNRTGSSLGPWVRGLALSIWCKPHDAARSGRSL